MAIRGFIIAIENYPSIEQGYSASLPGTIDSGLKFRDWLLTTKKADPNDIFFCTETGVQGRTAGASFDEIKNEIYRLGQAGKDRTEELYFFFCGHGFTFGDVPGTRRDNVLICADFRNPSLSGNSCLKLDEIQYFLRPALGGRDHDHYYFIDACRTQLASTDIRPGVLGLIPDASVLGEPTVYTLYSTRPGALAAVASDFPKALIDGLNGKGRAKTWPENDRTAMVVLFNHLKNYVKRRLVAQPVTSDYSGERDGEILKLQPPPEFACRLVVEDGAAVDRFDYELRDGRHHTLIENGAFTGPTHVLPPRVADDYYLSIRFSTAPCANVDPLPVSLYDDFTMRFRKSSGGAPPLPPGPPPMSLLDITLPPGATATLRNLTTGEPFTIDQSGSRSLPAGLYAARLLASDDGTHLEGREIEINSGEAASLTFAEWKPGPLRAAILHTVPGAHQAGAVDFSESLGPMPDQDLSVWLALIGASRILGEGDYYHKLSHLRLASFDAMQPGHCAFYLLAAFDDPSVRPRIGLTSGSGSVEWIESSRVENIPGLYEYAAESRPFGQYWPVWGPWSQPLLSFDVGNQPPVTVASCFSPNRVTLVTMSMDENSAVQIGQLLLPAKRLWDHLDRDVAMTLRNPGKLRSVKALAQAQRLFGQRRSLFAGARRHQLDEVLYLKWLDPIMASMAAYELIRRNEREHLPEVIKNLNRYFPEVPDTHAITRLVTGQGEMRGVPLFLDGLRAFSDALSHLPLPPENLDFQSPWTMWRGAVPKPAA